MLLQREVKREKGMKKIEKPGHMKDFNEEDLSFVLWKAELNKELMAFWKSLMNQ